MQPWLVLQAWRGPHTRPQGGSPVRTSELHPGPFPLLSARPPARSAWCSTSLLRYCSPSLAVPCDLVNDGLCVLSRPWPRRWALVLEVSGTGPRRRWYAAGTNGLPSKAMCSRCSTSAHAIARAKALARTLLLRISALPSAFGSTDLSSVMWHRGSGCLWLGIHASRLA